MSKDCDWLFGITGDLTKGAKMSQAQVSDSWFLFPGREGLNPDWIDWIISSLKNRLGSCWGLGHPARKPAQRSWCFFNFSNSWISEDHHEMSWRSSWNHWRFLQILMGKIIGSSGRLKKPWNQPRRPATSNSIRNLENHRDIPWSSFMLSKAPRKNSLVGGFSPPPLQNHGVIIVIRQLGWWHSQYDGKKGQTCSKPPISQVLIQHSEYTEGIWRLHGMAWNEWHGMACFLFLFQAWCTTRHQKSQNLVALGFAHLGLLELLGQWHGDMVGWRRVGGWAEGSKWLGMQKQLQHLALMQKSAFGRFWNHFSISLNIFHYGHYGVSCFTSLTSPNQTVILGIVCLFWCQVPNFKPCPNPSAMASATSFTKNLSGDFVADRFSIMFHHLGLSENVGLIFPKK